MALTRRFSETVVERVRQDPDFRLALVEETVCNLFDGDVVTALRHLRDIVNGTMGFDVLSAEIGIPKASLIRMLGARGNPWARNLVLIVKAICEHTGIRLHITAVPAH